MKLLALVFFTCTLAFPQASQRALVISQRSAATTARAYNGTATDHLTNSIDYFSGASAFTIAFWFKSGGTGQINSYLWSTSTGGNQTSVLYGYSSPGGIAAVEFYSPGFTGTDPRSSSGITIPDTNWHHIAYRYDGTVWAKFLDGTKTVINASITFATGTGAGVSSEWMDSTGGGGAPANGSQARFYLSTSALSDGQIAALAGSCSSSGVSGTVGYWLLGVASPETESSPSPNTHSLTVAGTTIVVGPPCTSQ